MFVWVIRDPEHITWISRLLTTALISAPPTLEVDARIHITGKSAVLPQLVEKLDFENTNLRESPSHNSSASEESKKSEMTPYSGFKTIPGRPNVLSILDDAISCASGPVSVDGKHYRIEHTFSHR